MEIKKERKTVLNSFIYAFQGLAYVLATQPHMKFHFIAGISVLILSLFLGVKEYELLVLFFTIVLVLTTEMINTSVETIVDIIKDNPHPLAKIAKDVAAGTVLFASINAIIVGMIILLPKIVYHAKNIFLK